MSNSLRISLKSGERIFINGAVLRAGRKASLELLNNASFLLEQHIIEPQDARTPLQRLYLDVQTAIMDPEAKSQRLKACLDRLQSLRSTCTHPDIAAATGAIEDLIGRERLFEILKLLRSLFPLEAKYLADA